MRFRSLRYVLATSLALLGISPPASGSFSLLEEEDNQRVEASALQFLKEQKVVGMSLALLRSGKPVYATGFGYADLAKQIPTSDLTMYRIASVAKPFTAARCIQLAESGLLHPERDVRVYVPEFPQHRDAQGSPLAITVRHLLAHQSGIGHYKEWSAAELERYRRENPLFAPLAAIDVFKHSKLEFAPGSGFRYTSFGYILLGAVIERAGRTPYTTQMQTMFRELGMERIRPEYRSEQPYPQESKGYRWGSGFKPLESKDNGDISWKLSAGGFVATVHDIAAFIQAYLSGKVFRRARTRAYFERRQALNDSTLTWQSVGFSVTLRNTRTMLFHDGNQGKARSLMYFDPQTGNGVVILSNTEGIDPFPLANKLMDILETSIGEHPQSGDPLSPPEPGRSVGDRN